MAFKKKNEKDVEVSINETQKVLDNTIVDHTEDLVLEPIKENIKDSINETSNVLDDTPIEIEKKNIVPVEKQKTTHKHPLKYVEEAMTARSWNVGNIVSIIQDFSTDVERETILNFTYENCTITHRIAILFEYVFGISHLIWLKYQSDYENN